jgi:hypothetical protein
MEHSCGKMFTQEKKRMNVAGNFHTSPYILQSNPILVYERYLPREEGRCIFVKRHRFVVFL